MRRALLAALLFLTFPLLADFREFRDIPVDPSIESKLRHAAERSLAAYPQLKADDLAISVVDLTKPALLARADFNGDKPFYPASVIKLFFMADVYRTRKQNLGDVQRALKEMIVESDNDATAFLIEILTNTAPGAELEGRALRKFVDRRREINRRFAQIGYDVSLMMKPWSFGPYGRERQLLGPNRENRNRLTANGTASLMLWIARRRAVSETASDAMLGFLERPLEPLRKDENQVKEFIGEALPPGSRLWSKAGWTSEVRHDAALIELPNGRRLVLVIFTRGLAKDVTLLPSITKSVLEELQ